MFMINKGLLWRTIIVFGVMVDIFLFVTGNPSLTYTFGAGLIIVPLLIIAAITGSYGRDTLQGKASKRCFVLHIILVAALFVVLFRASPYAREHAWARVQAEVNAFVNNPLTSTAEVSDVDRQLMLKSRQQGFTVRREIFIPTYRKAVYLLRTQQGESYELILDTSRSGKPRIALVQAKDGHREIL